MKINIIKINAEEYLNQLSNLDFFTKIKYSRQKMMPNLHDFYLNETNFIFRVGVHKKATGSWWQIKTRDTKLDTDVVYQNTAEFLSTGLVFIYFEDLLEELPPNIGTDLLFNLDLFT